MKKIWIFNHYAANTFDDRAGRHYFFAKALISRGWDVTVFCAATVHNSSKVFPTPMGLFGEDTADGIPYVFIKAPAYSGNGKSRIINMLTFAKNMVPVALRYAQAHGAPDALIASSVHPFTCVAGLRLAKKLKVPCISEIRDLWPESIVAYTDRKNGNPAVQLLYRLEKYIYTKSDKVIFTMKGGKDYITQKGWDKEHGGTVDLNKCFYINNGVDLVSYNRNREDNEFHNPELDEDGTFKVVYAGSLRKANNLLMLVDAAKAVNEPKIRFLIFGDGDDLEFLTDNCMKNGITNVVFEGRVDKAFVPCILAKSNLNILNYQKASTWQYGGSQNKLFEYLASGKPVCANVKIAYSPIDEYGCGVSENLDTPEEFAAAIRSIYELPQAEYEKMCENARRAACEFDFEKLTDRLVKALEAE